MIPAASEVKETPPLAAGFSGSQNKIQMAPRHRPGIVKLLNWIREPGHARVARIDTSPFHTEIGIEFGTPVMSDHDANRPVIKVR